MNDEGFARIIEEGNPEFEGIEDDEELQSVATAFEQYFSEATNELYNDEDYLKSIGKLCPWYKY